MKRKTTLFYLAVVLVICACKTSAPIRAMDDSGMMYAMVYDWENIPVSGASVYIDGKKQIETDIQGRFVLEFRKGGEYHVRLVKNGYEQVEETFTYDPMKVLYFKMVNAAQLLSYAEEALDEQAYPEAEALLNRALTLEQARPDLLYLRSVVLYYQGRNDEAKLILESLRARGIAGDHISEFMRAL
jgi:tetratricopeptide (TPR) repeat protein